MSTSSGARRRASRLNANGIAAVLVTMLLSGGSLEESPVADAAMRGEVETVRTLLRSGADVNAAQGDGMTALHWSAERGHRELAEMLVYAGAHLDVVTRLGDYTPLHLASRGGHSELVRVLLESGADATVVTSTGGATPLHLAAASGSADAIRVLVGHGAGVNARESGWGQTPLMFAASGTRVEAVRALLEAGADPSMTTLVVDIPALEEVDRAAGQVRSQVLDAFRTERDSDPSWRPEPSQVRAAVLAAQTIQRTRTTASDAPEAVVDEDSFVGYTGMVGTQGGMTALLHAVREGSVETAAALIDGGADLNQVSVGDHTSPILMATINGHFDLALDLLERGADPGLQSDAGATPLYAAINAYWAPKSRYPQQQAYQQQVASYLDVMRAVLEAGADPNVRLRKHLWYMSYTFDLLRVNVAGSTAFWRAAYGTDVEAMKLLVEYGADPDIPTMAPPARGARGGGRRGPTPATGPDPSGLPPVPEGGPAVWPLHAASGVSYGESYAGNSHRHAPDGWLPSVRYLVEELGADVNARDHNGYNAVHHAAARGDNELILYLVELGADVTAVSRRGQTTADMANGPQQRISPFPETIRLLESLGSKNNHNCVSC